MRFSNLQKAKTAEEILEEFKATVEKGEFFDLSQKDPNRTFRNAFPIDEIYRNAVRHDLNKKNFENWAKLVKSGKITELSHSTIESVRYANLEDLPQRVSYNEEKTGDFAARFIEAVKNSKLKKVEFSQLLNPPYDRKLQKFSNQEVEQFYAALPNTVENLSIETYESVKETEFKSLIGWLERTTAHPDVDIYTHNELRYPRIMNNEEFEKFTHAITKAHSFRFTDFGDSYIMGKDEADSHAFEFRTDLKWEHRGGSGEVAAGRMHKQNFKNAHDIKNRYVPNERVEKLLNAFGQKRAILNSHGELFFSSDENARQEYINKGIENGDACLAHSDLCERFDKARETLATRRREKAMKVDKILHTDHLFTNMKAPKSIVKNEEKKAIAIAYEEIEIDR